MLSKCRRDSCARRRRGKVLIARLRLFRASVCALPCADLDVSLGRTMSAAAAVRETCTERDSGRDRIGFPISGRIIPLLRRLRLIFAIKCDFPAVCVLPARLSLPLPARPSSTFPVPSLLFCFCSHVHFCFMASSISFFPTPFTVRSPRFLFFFFNTFCI